MEPERKPESRYVSQIFKILGKIFTILDTLYPLQQPLLPCFDDTQQ
jgi:hypothetical protein